MMTYILATQNDSACHSSRRLLTRHLKTRSPVTSFTNRLNEGGETMSQYYVEVYTYHPYKIDKAFTEQASSYAVAIKRAIDKFKKLEKLKKKKIKQIWATARIA
jgi:hypothetical protein